jgi:N-acetylglucosamine-6-phosphate deacetylase
MREAVIADYLFDGAVLHENAAVLFDAEVIESVIAARHVPENVSSHALPSGAWLAPGFIDIQVNGGGDVMFNDQPTAAGISAIAAAHRRLGTTSLLPTFITDKPKKMRDALRAVQDVQGYNKSVLGIHLEGPFISPEKPGIHDPSFIRTPGADDLSMLTAPRKGVLLLTLAPEQVEAGTIRHLTNNNVSVWLGHSTASYQQTRAAIAEGLSGFTHLFNAMPPLTARQPGPAAAAMESSDLWFGLIADGIHVDPVMLRLALHGYGQPVLVSDAMAPVGGHAASFDLYGHRITVTDGRCLREDGTLAGAYLCLSRAIHYCVTALDLPLERALPFASRHPAQALGLGHELGRLAPGYRADMVAFQPIDIRVIATWVAGSRMATE